MNDLLSLPINEQYQIDEDFLDGPAPTPPSLPSQSNSWPPQLIFDLALGLDSYEDIGLRHNLTEQQITKLYSHPLFRREVAIMTRELQESNAIFRNKAKVQAESYLETMDDLMHDPDTPAATKLSIFQALTKLGDLEPESKGKDQNNMPGTISINIAMEQAERRVAEIDITPRDIHGN